MEDDYLQKEIEEYISIKKARRELALKKYKSLSLKCKICNNTIEHFDMETNKMWCKNCHVQKIPPLVIEVNHAT